MKSRNTHVGEIATLRLSVEFGEAELMGGNTRKWPFGVTSDCELEGQHLYSVARVAAWPSKMEERQSLPSLESLLKVVPGLIS